MSPPSLLPPMRRVRDAVAARPARKAIAAISFLVTAALGSSCFTGTVGLEPPLANAYFPTALTISPGRSTLYIANSDFDLQYSGGTVLAVDLASANGMRTAAQTLANAIASGADQAHACNTLGLLPNDQEFTHPGPCTPLPLGLFVKKYATIGAFASQSALIQRMDGQPGARLFVTVRGDPSVTYFDIVDDRDPANPVSPCGDAFCLDCAASGDTKRCGPSHLIGTDPFDNQRGLKLPTEPTGIDFVPDVNGDPIVVAHQATAQASLLVNHWPGTSASGPTLEYSLGNLPNGPIGVVHIPPPAVVAASNGRLSYRPGFIISHRAAPSLEVVRYNSDAISAPERAYLTPGDTIPVTIAASTQGNDERSMTIDSTDRDACEANCTSMVNLLSCLETCLDHDLDLYVVSRAPASIMHGRIKTTAAHDMGGSVTGVLEVITLDDIIPLATGPSGISLGHIVLTDLKTGIRSLALRVFTVSFDTRFVQVYDPKLGILENEIHTGRGPYGIAFDSTPGDPGANNAEAFMYVGNFTDSYVSVVDLTERPSTNPDPTAKQGFGTFESTLINVGPPVPPLGDAGQLQ